MLIVRAFIGGLLSWRLNYLCNFWSSTPSSPPASSFPIEIAPYKSYTISFGHAKLSTDTLKALCTFKDKNKLPKPLKWLSGKQLPFFMRRFVCLYVTIQSGEVIKAKLDCSIKEYCLKMPLGMPLSDGTK